jgi:hypothetical protein
MGRGKTLTSGQFPVFWTSVDNFSSIGSDDNVCT